MKSWIISLLLLALPVNAGLPPNRCTGQTFVTCGGGNLLTMSQVNLGSQVTSSLPVANGGTGQTTYTDGQLLIGNTSGNTLTKSTLTAGSNVTITNGNGSITIAASTGGGSSPTVATKTANYTMVANDYILVDSSGGTFTLTLPTASGISGQSILVHKKTSDLTTVTINTTSSQTIGDGSATSVKIATQGEEWVFLSDGSNWRVSKHEADTGWISGAALTWNNIGSVTNESSWYMRKGDTVYIRDFVNVGSPAGATMSMTLPNAFTIDTTKVGSATNGNRFGFGVKLTNGTTSVDGGNMIALFFDGSATTTVFMCDSVSSNAYLKQNGNAVFSSGQGFNIDMSFAVSGWSP